MSSRLEPRAYHNGRATLHYYLALPPDYSPPSQAGDATNAEVPRWPLLLFLHGAGEKGNNLNKLLVYGPPRQVSQGRDFPFILVAPQCPPRDRWNVPLLNGLLDEVMRDYAVDPDRVVVSGVSMGGYGTWGLGIATPERFAALAPVCGGGNPREAHRLRSVPVWAFHGAKDDVVPLSASEEMVAEVVAAGGDAKLTIYPNAGHDAWTLTYDNPEVYDWLMAQRRAAPETRSKH